MAILIIISAWIINASMDAIDHAKGGETLYFLWHLLKTLSYGLLIGYIIILQNINWYIIIILLIALKVVWELTYRLARYYDLQQFDKELRK
jgi:hypothetical protein